MIEGLLADLRKEENATHIAALRLETYLTELEAANNAYRAITSQRLQARAANRKESGATIRARLGEDWVRSMKTLRCWRNRITSYSLRRRPKPT